MNNYFIYKENGDTLGRLERENHSQVADYLQHIYGDDAINFTIEEDNISWSDAPYLDDLALK